MQWQPIETAPKDGTNVLLFFRDWCRGGPLVTAGWWVDGADVWEILEGSGGSADAWMPLPPPPGAADE
jgi:hypothetical protein